jgi:hypothetical protein
LFCITKPALALMPVMRTTPEPDPTKVTVAGNDCAPTRVPSKFTVFSDTARPGLGPPRPVPAKTNSGGPLPLLTSCTVAVFAPAEAGAKRMLMSQLWPTANGVVPIGQVVVVTENAAASGPMALSKPRVATAGPLLVSVKVCVAETAPATTAPKSKRVVAGDQARFGTEPTLPRPRKGRFWLAPLV